MIITITIKVMMALVAAIVFDLWYDPVNGILIAASSRCVNRMAEHGSSHLGWENCLNFSHCIVVRVLWRREGKFLWESVYSFCVVPDEEGSSGRGCRLMPGRRGRRLPDGDRWWGGCWHGWG